MKKQLREPPFRVLLSPSRNPLWNLAAEEFLMEQVRPGHPLVLLYENDPAVILGRFQNPWKECRTGLARRTSVPLIRRPSGGGTVVHGPGNLNFAFINAENTARKDENLEWIVRSLKPLGLNLTINSRHDLVWPSPQGPRKVSGSAFRQRSASSLHHGTLLVNANLMILKELLHQSPRNIQAKGVASHPSPVANLNQQDPDLTVSRVVQSLVRGLGTRNQAEHLGAADLESRPTFSARIEELSSSAWVFEKTPAFREIHRDLIDGSTLNFLVEKGRIQEADNAEWSLGLTYQGDQVARAAVTAGRSEAWAWDLGRRIDGDRDSTQI